MPPVRFRTTNLRRRIAAAETSAAQNAALERYLAVKAAAEAAGTGYQPLDPDLTAFADLTPNDDDFLQRKSGAWTNRTIAQIKADLGIDALEAALGTSFQSAHAIALVSANYSDTVSIDDKNKDLRKWGARTTVGTGIETLITASGSETEETLLSSNGITTVVSSSSSDTQDIVFYEGHTISGSDATFLQETNGGAGITLTGTTPVTLPTAVFRASRAGLESPAAGSIYFYEGGTRTDANTHLIIPSGEIQTQKASTTISSADYWFITGARASVLEKTGAWAQFRIEIKPITSVYFYPLTEWVGASDASGTINLLEPEDPWLIVPKNHDVRMAVQANAANVDVAGGMTGVLAGVQ